jgi:hypothetical protein
MRAVAGVVVLAVLAAGCAGSSSAGSTDASAPGPDVTQLSVTGCQAFDVFMSDLESQGPQAQAQLVADAQAVQSGASGRLLTDATDLAGFVGSSSWPSEGNVNSAPVQKVQADCP